jgi:hypothetical protein
MLLGRQPHSVRLTALESSTRNVGDDTLITAMFKEW